MAPIALTPGETWVYQLIDDRLPRADGTRTKESAMSPTGTKFRLRALTAADESEVSDLILFEANDGEQLIHANPGTTNMLVLERGVVGFENFKHADGRDVPFRLRKLANGREVADLSFVEHLAHKHVVELAQAISARTKLTDDDKD